MALAHEIASARPDAAAEVIVHIVQGLQASGGSAGQAAPGMPLLHSAAHAADVVQVGALISRVWAWMWPAACEQLGGGDQVLPAHYHHHCTCVQPG